MQLSLLAAMQYCAHIVCLHCNNSIHMKRVLKKLAHTCNFVKHIKKMSMEEAH